MKEETQLAANFCRDNETETWHFPLEKMEGKKEERRTVSGELRRLQVDTCSLVWAFWTTSRPTLILGVRIDLVKSVTLIPIRWHTFCAARIREWDFFRLNFLLAGQLSVNMSSWASMWSYLSFLKALQLYIQEMPLAIRVLFIIQAANSLFINLWIQDY